MDMWGKLVVCWIALPELEMTERDNQTTFIHYFLLVVFL